MAEKFTTQFFEIGSRVTRGGKRPIKFILHRIMDSPDDYQENGVSWKEEYVNNAIKTIVPSDIAVEYIRKGDTADDTEISGHGFVGNTLDADGNPMPQFSEDSEVVGSITGAKVTTLKIDGQDTKVLLAEGVLYEHRCKGLVDWLRKNVQLGNVMGSVEIVGTPENENNIVYEDGYKPKGRVPKEYEYAGYSILSAIVKPADSACYVLEVNQKDKEDGHMDDTAIRALVDEIKSVISASIDKNEEYTKELNSLNACGADKDKEISEAKAQIETLNAALEQVNGEIKTLREDDEKRWLEQDKKYESLYQEKLILEKKVAEFEVEKRLAALDSALAQFSDDEKGMAEKQIKAFKCDPINNEVNSVIDAIYLGIGKRNKDSSHAERKAQTSEQNSIGDDGDIFAEVTIETTRQTEYEGIF